MIKYSTESGKVGINGSVFARIAVETAKGYSDRIILTNQKGKPIKVGTGGRESLNFIEVVNEKNGRAVTLRVYMIVRFGVSISRLARKYADSLKSEIKVVTGIDTEKIIICVTGVKSKKIAKRELEIVC
ncbi:MAG: Asp23/Gls24 family envelope stress response protein [Firmicutes bacterium]|nr:Asp23/Gls24 family envelope stress response protein [Bacillota bacterium]